MCIRFIYSKHRQNESYKLPTWQLPFLQNQQPELRNIVSRLWDDPRAAKAYFSLVRIFQSGDKLIVNVIDDLRMCSESKQGRIEPPEAARGHATSVWGLNAGCY